MERCVDKEADTAQMTHFLRRNEHTFKPDDPEDAREEPNLIRITDDVSQVIWEEV